MKTEHIALTISNKEEIANFYQQVMGMQIVKNFTIEKTLAYNIFAIAKDTPVYLLQNKDFTLEIFINHEQKINSFKHICLGLQNREALFETAERLGYEAIRIEREKFDLLFIKDKDKNIFELKER